MDLKERIDKAEGEHRRGREISHNAAIFIVLLLSFVARLVLIGSLNVCYVGGDFE